MLLTADFFNLESNSLYRALAVAVLGMLALLFTSHRKVVGYFMAGMIYWLVVEALAWVLRVSFSLESLNSYVFAVGLTFVPILLGLNWLEARVKARKESPAFYLKKPLNFTSQKSLTSTTRPSFLVAGQRPFMMEQDTDFSQHFIRHSSVFDDE